MSGRPRAANEDPVIYGIRTQRFPKERAGVYEAAMAADPAGTARLIESLYPLPIPLVFSASGPAADPEEELYRALYPSERGGTVRAAAAASPRQGVVVGAPDPYGVNPLVDDLRASAPAVYRAALAEGPAPRLFESGDLPAFTASGIDPAVLRSLPWQARHPAAETRDRAQALAIVEDCAGDGAMFAAMEFGPYRANQDYEARVRTWAVGAIRPGG